MRRKDRVFRGRLRCHVTRSHPLYRTSRRANNVKLAPLVGRLIFRGPERECKIVGRKYWEQRGTAGSMISSFAIEVICLRGV